MVHWRTQVNEHLTLIFFVTRPQTIFWDLRSDRMALPTWYWTMWQLQARVFATKPASYSFVRINSGIRSDRFLQYPLRNLAPESYISQHAILLNFSGLCIPRSCLRAKYYPDQ